MEAQSRRSELAQRSMGGRAENDQAAVLDVGAEDRAAPHRDRVVGIVEPVRRRPGNSRTPVAVDNSVPANVDDADHEVVLLGGDHELSTGIEEGVVRGLERLAGTQITGSRELPTTWPAGSSSSSRLLPRSAIRRSPGRTDGLDLGRVRARLSEAGPCPWWVPLEGRTTQRPIGTNTIRAAVMRRRRKRRRRSSCRRSSRRRCRNRSGRLGCGEVTFYNCGERGPCIRGEHRLAEDGTGGAVRTIRRDALRTSRRPALETDASHGKRRFSSRAVFRERRDERCSSRSALVLLSQWARTLVQMAPRRRAPMRTTGSTVISRDSIVWSSMEGGPKREIKEGACPRWFPCKADSCFSSKAATPIVRGSRSYSDSPAASRACARSGKFSIRITLRPRKDQSVK